MIRGLDIEMPVGAKSCATTGVPSTLGKLFEHTTRVHSLVGGSNGCPRKSWPRTEIAATMAIEAIGRNTQACQACGAARRDCAFAPMRADLPAANHADIVAQKRDGFPLGTDFVIHGMRNELCSRLGNAGLAVAEIAELIRACGETPSARFLRGNRLGDRIFASDDDILDRCCEAWNKRVAQPWIIMSIGLREGADRS